MSTPAGSNTAHAGKEELTAYLNELLEAERAGARVTLESARDAQTPDLKDLLRSIQRDEARWCAMLAGHLKLLGEKPTAQTGAFYGKAMAVTDLRERIAFLNRGQGWVVRKVARHVATPAGGTGCADLAEMLRSHEINIARANEAMK